MDSPLPIIVQDTREDVGTWSRWIGDRCTLVRGWEHASLKKPACLPTGDYCLENAFIFDETTGKAVFAPHRLVERKTASDFYGCCTASRDRFKDELKRMRELAEIGVIAYGQIVKCKSLIVVEATYAECLQLATCEHAMSESSFEGTVRAWDTIWHPIVFCGSERAAACYSFVFLTGVMQ